MPPVVIDSSESDFGDNSNGAAVNITSDVKRGKQKVPLPTTEIATNGAENDVKGKKNGNNVVVDEDDEEDSDEEEEELYIVENIVNHDVHGGAILYNVKWQGYSDKDNTWEPEENLAGAHEALEAYFERIGGRPTDASKPNAKKRGRKSMSETNNTPKPPTKRPKSEVAVRPGRRKKEGSPSAGEDKDEPKWSATKANNEWMPPKPRKDAWEDMLLSVEALEADPNDGTKWAFVLWAVEDENGKKRTSKVRLDSVYVAAPQAILRFYEAHLVFTKSPTKATS